MQKQVGKDQELWYQRFFTIPDKWSDKNVVLNFGAVDWKADVWVILRLVHTRAGYTPFSFTVAQYL